MKISTKRFLFILVCTIAMAFASVTSSAQCSNNNVFYTDLTTTFDGDIQSAGCVYGGEYCTAAVCSGVTYIFSTCDSGWDTQITLYTSSGTYLAYNDDGCGDGFGGSYLTWTSNYTGTINIVVDEYSCLSNTICGNISVEQIGSCSGAGPCVNNNTFYNVNATPSGAGNTAVVNCIYAGEYVNVTVCNGASYTFSTCDASYDTEITLYNSNGTLLDYDDDGCGVTFGGSDLTWTATFNGTVRVLVDQYPCTSNSTCTALSVTQNTSCGGACSFSSVSAFYDSCVGEDELVYFYPYYTGLCTIAGVYINTTAGGLEYLDLSAYGFTSGEAIGLYLALDNTLYSYYFVLSDNTTSSTYFYQTGNCGSTGCAFYDLTYDYLGCSGESENLNFYPYYEGACTISGMWTYTPQDGWFYLDLSADGFVSGDAIGILFNYDYTTYEYYFELSDGTLSPTYVYTTGGCDIGAACTVNSVQYLPNGCNGTAENVSFFVNYTGDCSVYSMWIYTSAAGWQEIVLTGGPFYSGDEIGIDFLADNTVYDYYFELSDGNASLVYTYVTGNCDNPILCSNLTIDYTDTGCYSTVDGNIPSGDITPFYAGSCTVEGVYSSVNGGAFEYLDLSTYGFTSGDPIGLLFNQENANYEVYYVLSDGSESPSVFFINGSCESGITICDCAGTQLPIEATAWLGDGSLDDGTYFWNNDASLPVNFNCATWGFDCGDELPAGYYIYDPYGVCAGALPPSNGCVDEFCYNIDLDIQTDCYPEEVTAYILNEDGNVVFSASGADFLTAEYTLYTFNMCLPAGCYTYEIYDSFGDGMSSTQCTDIGFTGIYDYSQAAYVVSTWGDGYTSVFAGEFCVGPQTTCDNLELIINEEACIANATELLPHISYQFLFSGPCTVQSLFYSIDGGDFTELDVSANGWNSGDIGELFYMQPNAEYLIYYTTNDGASSYLYSFTTGDCSNEITICDCAGTQLTIGATSWLGDGFADNGFYQWAGEYVDFNCSTWGYDCGDIQGAPSLDLYNVCDGQLPPFNGCIDITEVLGCTDPSALNYNPAATINDGSCIYSTFEGCTDEFACNYNPSAQIDNGSCEYITCAGCTDPAAVNYDPTATISDNSCLYQEIEGCTDPSALNYDPNASVNDGSCIYSCVWPGVVYDSYCSPNDLNAFYIDVDLTTLGNGGPYTITNSYNDQQQVMSLLGSVTMGPFPNNQPVVVPITSNPLATCFLTSQPLSENCNVVGVYGCTDPTALNYNANATIDDGSCIYISVEEIETGNIAVYPNPAFDQVNVRNNHNVVFTNLRILDQTGRVVYNSNCSLSTGNTIQIAVSDLAQGSYTLELSSSSTTEREILIIQK